MEQEWMKGKHGRLKLILLCLILLLGGYLRFGAVARTVVDHPFRSDVGTYYKTAYNLNTYGVYSHSINVVDGKETAPAPDAFVTPGYPLFLTLFVEGVPTPAVFTGVALWQSLMGLVTLLLVFYLFEQAGGYAVGTSAMFLAAISPHLVNSSLYMISETLFALLLASALVTFAAHLTGPRRFLPALLAAGMLFGAAALTRPVVQLFPLLLAGLLFLHHPRRQALKGGAVLLLGFLLLWVPWVIRNEISIGKAGDSSVMVNTFTNGMYPGLEYDHRPETLARPYDFDPRTREINASFGSALQELSRRFHADTAEELEWYLVGKPTMLWSWDVIEGGMDAYVYAVLITPYRSDPVFRASHALMFLLHWPLVVLAFATALYTWLPQARRRLSGTPLLIARATGLLLLYNTGVLMVLAPFVRYSIPFLPLLFGMAALGVLLVCRWLRERRAWQGVSVRAQ